MLPRTRTHNSLSIQRLPRREFLLLSAAGTYRFLATRPVDVLRKVLELGSDQALADFFRVSANPTAFQHIHPDLVRAMRREACATCLIIVCSSDDLDQRLKKRASDAFKRFGGEPEILSSEPVATGPIDLGHAAIGPRVVYSAAHDGTCLYVGRILAPIWESPLACADPLTPSQIASLATNDVLHSLAIDLRNAYRYMEASGLSSDAAFGARQQWEKMRTQRMMKLVRPRTAVEASREASKLHGSMQASFASVETPREKWEQYLMYDRGQAAALENESFAALSLLVRKCIEFLSFWEILNSNEFSSVLGELKDADRLKIVSTSFANLVTTEDGERLVKSIIDKLLERVSGKPQHKVLSEQLYAACPTIHNQHAVLRANAQETIMTAHALHDRKLAQTAVSTFQRLFRESDQFSLSDLQTACDALISGEFVDECVVRSVKIGKVNDDMPFPSGYCLILHLFFSTCSFITLLPVHHSLFPGPCSQLHCVASLRHCSQAIPRL